MPAGPGGPVEHVSEGRRNCRVESIRGEEPLSGRSRNIIMIVVVASLIAINVYTVETFSLKSSTPIPGYPSVSLAYSGGQMMILIRGALGPYIYNNITINGSYVSLTGGSLPFRNYTSNAIYLAISLPARNATFNSTALDLANHEVYYFNATVSVNLSARSTDTVYSFSGGETNSVVLGTSPLESPMEGYSYA